MLYLIIKLLTCHRRYRHIFSHFLLLLYKLPLNILWRLPDRLHLRPLSQILCLAFESVMFSKMIQPKKILEIGTYTGYSALCMSEGLQDGGMLHTIELNPEHEDMIRKYFGPERFVSERFTSRLPAVWWRTVCGDWWTLDHSRLHRRRHAREVRPLWTR